MPAQWLLYRNGDAIDSGEAPTIEAAKRAAKAKLRSLLSIYWAKVWDDSGSRPFLSSRNRAGAISFNPSKF